MANIRAFNPEIPQEEVDRLFQKLKDTRSPTEPIVPDAGKTMVRYPAGVGYSWTNTRRPFIGMGS